LSIWGCTRVFNLKLRPICVDNGGEFSLSFLTSVKAIPTVVHIRVELIVKTTVGFSDVNRLHTSVHPVCVQAVERNLTNIVVGTQISIPHAMQGAARNHLRRYRLFVV